jgi:hypothetical protein
MVVSLMIAVPFLLGRPSWAAVHPYYERLCPDPTPLPDFFENLYLDAPSTASGSRSSSSPAGSWNLRSPVLVGDRASDHPTVAYGRINAMLACGRINR